MEDLSIIAASFWENWNYAKELSRMGSSKAKKQFEEAMKIRQEWQLLKHKNKLKQHEKDLLITNVSNDDVDSKCAT